jgi:preprotein translocase subunit Sss1
MNPPSLIKRLLASGFVLVGAIGMVLVIWPDGITDLDPEQVTAVAVARAIAAVAAGTVGLIVLLTFWDDDFG